jgi:glycosyltransferase involved in cell wall biosynthesis
VTLAPRRRTVLRLIARLNVGGPARHVVLMSHCLDETRWRTVLVTGITDGTEAEMSDLARDAGLELEVLPDLGRSLRPLRDLRAFAAILRTVRRHRPDVVCTHTAKAGALGRIAAFVHRVPARVHTFHGHVFHGYFSKLASRVAVLVERGLGRITSRILAVSEEVARDLVEVHRVAPREKVLVMKLGLDLDEFLGDLPRGELRADLGIDATAPLLAAVGRLVPVKDHALMLEAFARLREPHPEAHLALVGDGPCRPDLEARAARPDLEGHVHFTGWRRDLPAILGDMDLAVLSSRNEGTPVALIEASAAGRAAVATDVGGVREVVEHEGTGLLVPHGDADAFAAACARLLDDPDERRRLGEAGRSRVRDAYSAPRLCAEMTRVYEDCLRSDGSRA